MQLPGLIFIAAVGGAVVALQAQFMGVLDESLGTMESVFITYFGGGLLIGLFMLIQRGGNLGAWQQVPWYTFASGPLGVSRLAGMMTVMIGIWLIVKK